MKSLGRMVANEADRVNMLPKETLSGRWDEVLEVGRCRVRTEDGCRTTFPVFQTQNMTAKASKKTKRESALQENYKDLSL